MSKNDGTNELSSLSRRKLLGGVATIGAAGALGGMGTMAFFSDEEEFANNQLVAGSLDLKVGWEEHYSDWSDDEDDGLQGDVRMGGNASRVGLPLDAQDAFNGSMVNVANISEAHTFQNNTEVGMYPSGFDPWEGIDDPCANLPDSSDQSPVIIDLDDVKPGDFGEITFSFALCDNPGYLWLTGGLQSADENGYSEPERKDPDETGDADGDGEDDTVELLDKVRTAFWYDNGDNLLSGGGGATGEVDVVIALDESGSMSNPDVTDTRDAAADFIDLLDANDHVGNVAFATSAVVRENLTSNFAQVKNTIQTTSRNSGGIGSGTDIADAINTSQSELDANGRASAEHAIIILSDGFSNATAAANAADQAKSKGTTMITLGFGGVSGFGERLLKVVAGTTPNSLTDWNDGAPDDDEGFFYDTPTKSELEDAFDDISKTIQAGEEIIFRGTLREALNTLSFSTSSGGGIPLDGDTSSAFDEVNGDPASVARDCFEANNQLHHLGFAWWLPVNHANEIQTDSATFRLGFYTEQCRHNDGSGQFGNA